MSNVTPEGSFDSEPLSAPPRQANPWKISTFVVGGAGLALAVITGLSGVMIGAKVDHRFGFGGRDRETAAAERGWPGDGDAGPRQPFDMGDRGHGRHHDMGVNDERDGVPDGGDRGLGMMDDDPADPSEDVPPGQDAAPQGAPSPQR